MEHGPCELVVKHEGVLGGMQSDIKGIKDDVEYIKDKIDNGLKLAVTEIKDAVVKTRAVQQERVENNWIGKIFEGSVKKFLGLLFLFMLIGAAMNTGFWAYFKTYGFLEKPGQQKEIHLASTNGAYHEHFLPDGRIILHGNDPDKPAWIIDPVTKQLRRCPQFRTDETIGIK